MKSKMKYMNERKPIEIEIELNEGDFWRVSFAGRIKRFLLVNLIYLPIALLMLYFVAFGAGANPLSEKNWSLLFVFFVIIAIPFVFLIFGQHSLRKLAKKLAKASEKTHFTFSENEIETNSLTRSSKLTWDNYEKIQETNEDYVGYLKNYTFHTIPKRFFKSEEQIIDFRELVRAKLGDKAKLKS